MSEHAWWHGFEPNILGWAAQVDDGTVNCRSNDNDGALELLLSLAGHCVAVCRRSLPVKIA
jgi:hypothetical protein